jgi:hypothetical protein
VQQLAEPSAPRASFLAATTDDDELNLDDDELNLLFVKTFAARAEQLGLKVGARTCATAQHYLEVARSTPCFVRLLAATGPPSRHGRCSHCSVMIWM